MTRSRSGLESRLGEISAEAQELRIRLSDLEMQAADRGGGALGDPGPVERAGGGQPTAGRGAGPGLGVGERAPCRAGRARGRMPGAGAGDRRSRRGDRRAGRARPWSSGWRRIDEARQAEMESIRARLGELEADNRRLGEERDRAEALARELRAGLDEREAACQEQARVIAGRDAEIAALAERGPGRSAGGGASSSPGGDRGASGPASRELEIDNRRLGEERDRAEALARELRAGLDERDTVVASLGSRLTELLAARERANDRDPRCQRDGQPARGANRRARRADRGACGASSPRWDRAREVARPRCSRFEISSPRGKTTSRPWSLAWSERSITWGWSDGSEPTCAVSSRRPPGSS